MIIESLCNLIYKVVTTLLNWVNIPSLGSDFLSSFNTVLTLALTNARGIISLFIPWRIVQIGIPIVLVVVSVRVLYPLVMWVLRKIPVAAIS